MAIAFAITAHARGDAGARDVTLDGCIAADVTRRAVKLVVAAGAVDAAIAARRQLHTVAVAAAELAADVTRPTQLLVAAVGTVALAVALPAQWEARVYNT